MTNLEFLQSANAEEFTKHLSKSIDGLCEQAYSTKEDEQGLLITCINKEKFVNWLNKTI